jgi:hypothetical protein
MGNPVLGVSDRQKLIEAWDKINLVYIEIDDSSVADSLYEILGMIDDILDSED